MKGAASLLISLSVLGFIYWRVDLGELWRVLATARAWWLAAALALVAPLTAISACRWKHMLPASVPISLARATEMTLVVNALNIIMPSKIGDFAKAYFLRGGSLPTQHMIALVMFEKIADVLALLAWCAIGLFVLPPGGALMRTMTIIVWFLFGGALMLLVSARFASILFSAAGRVGPRRMMEGLARFSGAWAAAHRALWAPDRSDRWGVFRVRAARILGVSIVLWLLHLTQIGLFAMALGGRAPVQAHLGLAPLAVLAGLLPFTVAGIGTRDAALVVFYAPYFEAPMAAALGVLCMLRNLMPALAGLPFLARYLGAARAEKEVTG